MRLPLILAAALGVGLAACSGAEEPASEMPQAVAALIETAPPAEAKPPAAARDWTREEVEFAFMCRGVISAAYASRTILPEADRAEALNRITMGTAAKWTSEAFARADAAGLSQAEQDALLSSSTRVLASPLAINEALPDIEACLEVIA
ncbi:hypothetical protein K1X12_09675 [Hyphomonas sp. WL0036]|uniref:hypothetical protein n=1 Tax=Hyphomonas sediminis TaxID=2866160 RepID=UPI001C816544|nr:hypothetical protein [Hyphomonas sediminis]MBY9067167.1 hypothetical protein [Hyphomonas sediminis]